MHKPLSVRTWTVLLVGVAIGVCLTHGWRPSARQGAAWADEPSSASPDTKVLSDLRSEVDRLKGVVPDQSHSMTDVNYHFTNLWFAAEHENWPLADFYFSETKSHLNWAVRIIPVRKNPQGQQIVLKDILEGIENGPMKTLGKTVADKDHAAFVNAYRIMLTSCYSCHQASGKPYIRLQVPSHPFAGVMNFSPDDGPANPK